MSRRRVAIEFPETGLTVQSEEASTNVNKIVERVRAGGSVTNLRSRAPRYMDVSFVGSYHESLNRVLEAQEAFMTFPATIRARFENDPGKMLVFLANPANKEEAIKLGLSPKPPEPPAAAKPA